MIFQLAAIITGSLNKLQSFGNEDCSLRFKGFFWSMATALWLLMGCQAKPVTETTFTPRYIVYYNSDAAPLKAAVQTTYSHIILSFLRVVVDAHGNLQLLVPEAIVKQSSAIPELQAAGKKVLISFGGGEAQTAEYTALIGREKELAGMLAAYVKQYQLDGIDIDFEASAMLHQQRPADTGDGRAFLIALTRALRAELPSPRYLLSHAPQPPYLDPDWHAGPYLQVLAAAGEAIDWIMVQYYDNPGFNNPVPDSVNKNNSTLTSYPDLVSTTGRLHWPSRKVVVGKPIYKDDAGSGYISPDQIITTIIQPLLQDYGKLFGGLAGWQFSTLTADHQAWNHQVGNALGVAAQ